MCFLYLNNVIWPETDGAIRSLTHGDHLRLQIRADDNTDWCSFEYMENAARQRRIFESSPEPVDDPADAEQSSIALFLNHALVVAAGILRMKNLTPIPCFRLELSLSSRSPSMTTPHRYFLHHNSPGTVIMILFIPMSLTAGVMMRFMWLIPLLILTMFFPQLQATLRVTRISALA